jgi:glycosyltransferase involved in cell wall biosynthesis
VSTHRRALPCVCLVAELPPPVGGMAIQAARLGEALRLEGHSVRHVRTNALRHGSVLRRVPLLRGVVNLTLFIASLVRRVRGVDIIHVFAHSGLSFYLFAVPPIALGRLIGRHVVVHYHGGAAPQFLRNFHGSVVPWLRLAHVLLVPSAFLSRTFHCYGLRPIEIPNLVDPVVGQRRAPEPAAPRMLMARNLTPVYNIGCGLRAFREVLNRFPRATLTVAGDGPDRTGLQALAQKLDLGDRCQFVGSVDNGALRRMMLEADVLLNTSRTDNQPVSIVEAFSAGTIVVSTNVGGISDLVMHEADGLLAPDDDHLALASQVLRVLEDPSLARRLAERAIVRAVDFTWPRIYPTLTTAYAGEQVS